MMTPDLLYPAEPRIRWDYSQINELLLWATHSGMSDLCLRSGLPAWMRLNGAWRQVTQRPITTDELLAALERLTRNNSVSAQIKSGQSDYDFSHEIEEARGVRRRYRGNATPVADGYSTGVKIVFRAIPSMPPALEDLHMESAEIGVAAYSTVHTRSVPETLSRIINVFPFAERLQVTATLLSSLRLIISQRLLPLPDGNGRVALREYLAFTPEIRETLLDTPLERLILKTEDLLAASGQRMQDAAQAAYEDGRLARENYLAILAERKSKEAANG